MLICASEEEVWIDDCAYVYYTTKIDPLAECSEGTKRVISQTISSYHASQEFNTQ